MLQVKHTITIQPEPKKNVGTWKDFAWGTICEIVGTYHNGELVIIPYSAVHGGKESSAFISLETGDQWGKQNSVQLRAIVPGTEITITIGDNNA